MPKGRLRAAFNAATNAPNQYGRQTSAIRREIPWKELEVTIQKLSEGGATRCNG
jgi:hypothetical protein